MRGGHSEASVEAVVFDVGGVLAADIWEPMFLDPRNGIGARYGIAPETLRTVGKDLWKIFAHAPRSEKEYWQAFLDLVPIPASVGDLIDMTGGFLKPVRGTRDVLDLLKLNGLSLAVLSNNTCFWFERQARMLRLDEVIESAKVVLSCYVGVSKSSSGFEMYHRLEEVIGVDRSQCVVVDDHPHNVDRASEFGMLGLLFQSPHQLHSRLQELGALS